MTDMPAYLSWPVYGLPQETKVQQLLPVLHALTQRHATQCKPYGDILKASGYRADAVTSLADIPFIPVRLFKEHDLVSVPQEEVFKVLTSSGTTSQKVSRIYLDRATSQAQTKALVMIMQQFLGKARLPMLVIDHPNVIRDRTTFSARGAGILGMSSFGRDHTYALRDEDMQPDMAVIRSFAEKYDGQPILIFGFTFMIWQYFIQVMQGKPPIKGLEKAIVIHSGGWKKLIDQAVDNTTFKQGLHQAYGIRAVHNFYGMVEQVGSVFVECEHGHLHTPAFADVIIRNPHDWSAQAVGHAGIIQVLSALPGSYPGHSLLTEDTGTITGIDQCPCGRLGKTFLVHGRVARAEIRGCSDTHAASLSG